MKNLLVITNNFPDEEGKLPLTTFVKDNVNALKEQFTKIYVICPTPYYPSVLNIFWKNKYTHFSKLKSYSYDNVEVYFSRYILLPISFHRKKAAKNALRAAKKILSQKKIAIDSILAHFSKPSGIIAASIAKEYNIEYVITLHENPQWLDTLIQSWDKELYKSRTWSRALIRVNPYDMDKLEEFNNNIYHYPNWYDQNKFYDLDQNACREKLALQSHWKILITIGRLHPIKNQANLIKACKILVDEGKTIKLIIIWSWPEKKNLEKLIVQEWLTQHISLAGAIPNQDLVYWLNASDLFILPSLAESFWVVLLEALWCGIPVISTPHWWPQQIVTKESWLLIPDVHDPISIKETITKWLNTSRDTQNIIHTVKKKYSLEKLAKNYWDLLLK